MWTYRLYRYPSPSSSSLVYGLGKGMDEDMPHNCPQSIANAVYTALEGGGKLPHFVSTEEVRKALMDFVPNSNHPTSRNSDCDNGNEGSKQGKVSSLGKGKRKGEQTENDLKCKKGKRKTRTAAVLMLEALSKRRMDAVQQLHEACPQLLASIPIFEPAPSSQQPLRSNVGQGGSTLWATPGASPTVTSSDFANFLSTSDPCPLQQRSYLLDVAAENKALLVFVLEQHPGISHRQPQAQATSCSNSLEDDEDGESLNQLPNLQNTSVHSRDLQAVGTDSEQQNNQADGDVFGILSATRDDMNEQDEEAKDEMKSYFHGLKENKNVKDDPLSELDPTSPITICIRKKNFEVLRYLLYKHVWQHFLLDDIFKLNQVSGSDTQELSSSCPECTGFLPCATLVGCSYLLDLLICGKFCTHSSAAFSRRSTHCTVKTGDNASEVENKKDTTKSESLVYLIHEGSNFTSQNRSENETGTGPSSDHAPDLCSDNESTPTSSPVPAGTLGHQSSEEHVDKSPSCGSSQKTFTKSTGEYGSSHELPDAGISKLPGDVLDSTRETIPSGSRESDITPVPSSCNSCYAQEAASHSGSCHEIKTESQVADAEVLHSQAGSDSRMMSQATQILNPNFQVPVSLPIMDRWISRCMHVRLAPLHLACWRCDPASIRVLIHHGAHVNLMAEELENSNVKEGSEGNVLDSGESRVASPHSSDSSLEQALNFVSVTVDSSSFDMAATNSSMEDLLKRKRGRGGEAERSVLSPLALLALGIRSPPDFSLSIGRSLGLVLPTLPVLWSGQTDRSCSQAKLCLMEALRLLLDAGCNANQISTVFGKTFSVMELFLQPSVDLYYAPLMPRGGRDSAVLRCMDLEYVADLVLSACWELSSRGGRLGTNFSSSLEWNLFRMDWMFLKNENVQRRFLHLAIFLGLFPPLDPVLLLDSLASRGKTSNLSTMATTSQRNAGTSRGGVDITQSHLPPHTLPPRPSCIPWAPSTSARATPPLSSSSSGSAREVAPVAPVTLGTVQLQQLQSTEVVTSYYSTVGTQASQPENRVAGRTGVRSDISSVASSRASLAGSERYMSEISSAGSWSTDGANSVIELRSNTSGMRNSVREELPSTLNNTGGNIATATDSQGPSIQDVIQRRLASEVERESSTGTATRDRIDSAPTSGRTLASETLNLNHQGTSSPTRTASDRIERSEPAAVTAQPGFSTAGTNASASGTKSTRCPTSGSSMRAQMEVWALEEHQRRCLEKFVNDVLRLSVPEQSLILILSFMRLSDLYLLASITQHVMTTAPVSVESRLHRFHNAVCRAQSRSLRHCCKLVILAQTGWRHSALDCLPLPDSLKRYLMDSQC